MKKILFLSLFLTILGLLSAGVLAGLYQLTSSRREEIEINKQNEALIGAGITNIQTFEVPSDKTTDGVTLVKTGLNQDNKEVFAIYVEGENAYIGIELIVIFTVEDQLIYDIVFLSGLTTHAMDSPIKHSAADMVTSSSNSGQINNVSGATVSVVTFNNLLDAAKAQFMKVAVKLPNIVSYSQDYFKTDLAQNKLFYNIEFELEGTTYQTEFKFEYLKNNWEYVSGLESLEPADQKAFSDALAANFTSSFRSTVALFAEVNGDETVVRVSSANGYVAGGRVILDITFDQDGVIIKIEYLTGLEEDSGYSDEHFKGLVEAGFLNKTDGDFDNVSGATVTSNSLKNALKKAISVYAEVKK